MNTVEQVEKLRTMANISYEEAKEALTATNGDMLEAIINLEKQGKVNPPPRDGYYSSRQQSTDSTNAGFNEDPGRCCGRGKNAFHNGLKQVGSFLMTLLHKGNVNIFEMHKDRELKAAFPITVLAILLFFAFWVTVPLIVIGALFGYRYRFSGPDFDGNAVNNFMDEACDAVDEFKKNVQKDAKLHVQVEVNGNNEDTDRRS